MKHWGVTSNYLHWVGEPAETVESDTWFNTGVQAVEDAARSIWEKASCGDTSIMMPHDMQPEIRLLWERFKAGKTDCAGVKRTAKLALPILRNRTKGTRLQGDQRSVERFSVEPGKVGLTTLKDAGDSIDQDAKGRLTQLATGLAQR